MKFWKIVLCTLALLAGSCSLDNSKTESEPTTGRITGVVELNSTTSLSKIAWGYPTDSGAVLTLRDASGQPVREIYSVKALEPFCFDSLPPGKYSIQISIDAQSEEYAPINGISVQEGEQVHVTIRLKGTQVTSIHESVATGSALFRLPELDSSTTWALFLVPQGSAKTPLYPIYVRGDKWEVQPLESGDYQVVLLNWRSSNTTSRWIPFHVTEHEQVEVDLGELFDTTSAEYFQGEFIRAPQIIESSVIKPTLNVEGYKGEFGSIYRLHKSATMCKYYLDSIQCKDGYLSRSYTLAFDSNGSGILYRWSHQAFTTSRVHVSSMDANGLRWDFDVLGNFIPSDTVLAEAALEKGETATAYSIKVSLILPDSQLNIAEEGIRYWNENPMQWLPSWSYTQYRWTSNVGAVFEVQGGVNLQGERWYIRSIGPTATQVQEHFLNNPEGVFSFPATVEMVNYPKTGDTAQYIMPGIFSNEANDPRNRTPQGRYRQTLEFIGQDSSWGKLEVELDIPSTFWLHPEV